MILRENINSFWASLIIEEMVRNGVEFFCISPGSRSTPLTIAAARHAGAECVVCHDERGAAFMALGFGKATGRPAALICTSGTAAANYFPAIIEACMDDTPLIVLTADRPPELLDSAANQTILQENIYGDYVRWSIKLPPPSEEISPAFVLTTVDQALHRAVTHPAGPVHLNCQFREPLAPTPTEFIEKEDSQLIRWEKGNKPFTTYSNPTLTINDNDIHRIADIVNACKNGLVILGRRNTPQQRQPEIGALLSALGWPVHADIASGFRLGAQDWPVLDELSFQNLDKLKSVKPEIILHLGGTFLSKKLQQHLESLQLAHYILVHENPKRIDPGHILTQRLQCDVAIFASQLAALVDRTHSFVKNEHRMEKQIDELLSSHALSEPGLARMLSQHLPVGHGLFLSNSMPVRDMNKFAAHDCDFHPVGTNRGASGIDGIIASATGFARGLKKPVTVVIGDVAFLHDLNSLILMRNAAHPITLICINNNGGGIFSQLPIANFEDVFETYFTTPHNLSFEHSAQMFNLNWAQPRTKEDLHHELKSAWSSEESSVIEIKTSPQNDARLRIDLKNLLNMGVASS
jgi:2-succinyl-5-enolpyruvyl-6-hydroxy-3-cyclohexene-1-carboxylate synthase